MTMLDMLFYDRYGNAVLNMTQWDSDQTLYVFGLEYPIAPYFQFETSSTASSISIRGIYMQDGSLGVVIPNVLLQQDRTIVAYVYVPREEGGGRVVGKLLLPIRSRQKPEDYEYRDNSEDEPDIPIVPDDPDEPDTPDGLFPGDFYPGDNIYPQGES